MMTAALREHAHRKDMLRAWAAHDAEIFQAFTSTVTRLMGRSISALRVLDLGCGANAPMTVLLHAAGCPVTGVDAELGFRWGLGWSARRLTSYGQQAGIGRMLRKSLGELVYDRDYFRHLAALTGLRLSDSGLDLRVMDVQQLSLPVETFDVVHSNATWEHIADVPAANRTVARALKPGGIAYIEIHLFPSLSGGHDLPWIVPGKIELGGVKPWRHLTDASWTAPVFLNRLRERDYRASFEKAEGMRIEDWRVEYTEGHDLLTPERRASLAQYTDEELTTRSIIVVARKV